MMVVVLTTMTSCNGSFWESMSTGMYGMGGDMYSGVPYGLRPDVAASQAANASRNQLFSNIWQNGVPSTPVGTYSNTTSTTTRASSNSNSSRSSSSSSSTTRTATSRQHDLCNGTGKCNTCNGTGSMWRGYGLSGKTTCPNCNGRGRCSGCGGTGKAH